jgi:hypothetical protein
MPAVLPLIVFLMLLGGDMAASSFETSRCNEDEHEEAKRSEMGTRFRFLRLRNRKHPSCTRLEIA